MKVRLALSLILVAALTRLGLQFLPVPPHNFSPISAMGLFAAAYLGQRWLTVAVPFAALFLSDLVLNNVFYGQYFDGFVWVTSVWSYASFGLVLLAGWMFLHQKVTTFRVLGASLSASVIFFLVSNFIVWTEGLMYSKNLAGLMSCYAAGLPFLQNTVMGDLFFTAVMFGTFAWMTRKSTSVAQA